MVDYVLAVDGGNTKTVALVARPDGLILGAGRAGCADIYGAGSPEAALAQIDAAAAQARTAAGIGAAPIEAGAFSLAGADWPEDFDLLRGELLRRGLAQRVLVCNDALGALRAGSPDGTGVAVVLGTATAIGARSAEGRAWHSSFWQWEGAGAIDLGTAAVRLVLRAELGIDPPTRLTARVLEAFQADTVEALLHSLTRRGAPRRSYAPLAPIVLEAAEQGDEAARQVVERCAHTAAEYALAAARLVGLGPDPFPLVLSGGVLRAHPAALVNTLVQQVQAVYPAAVPVRAAYEPVVGALFLVLESLGVCVDDAVQANIRASLPPAALFLTPRLP